MPKPRAMSKSPLLLSLGALALIVAMGSIAYASVLLAPGTAVGLPGSTAAAEPDLAGVVLYDTLINFEIKNASGGVLCRGQLQNRVVRSSRNSFLHFYYRIRGAGTVTAVAPGRIRRVATSAFAGFDPLRVDFRPDGLGFISPRRALRNAAPGPAIAFDFNEPLLPCSSESRFFFVKTHAVAFAPSGETRIILVTGESVLLPTVMPVP